MTPHRYERCYASSDWKNGANDMIDSMEYLALGVGVTFGLVYLHLSQAIDWILVVIHYAFFRSKKSFYGLYDNTEQESVYEHLKYTETIAVKDYVTLPIY